jgi:hypothetical protein
VPGGARESNCVSPVTKRGRVRSGLLDGNGETSRRRRLAGEDFRGLPGRERLDADALLPRLPGVVGLEKRRRRDVRGVSVMWLISAGSGGSRGVGGVDLRGERDSSSEES